MFRSIVSAFVLTISLVIICACPCSCHGEFLVGAASGDITPQKNTALWGQFHLRLSTRPQTELTANAIAVKSGDATTTLVSLDLLQLPKSFEKAVRNAVAAKDASISTDAILFIATHTHTAPVLELTCPGIPENDQTYTVKQTHDFLADKISDVIIAAWKDLEPAKFAYGLDRNSIGFGRRVCYSDGSARMYGNTNQPNFVNLEGMDDDDVGVMYFIDPADQVKALLINVTCTAQVVENNNSINADYWNPVRELMKARFGNDVVVCSGSAPAGDMSPRPLLHKEANARMRRLRGINEMQELARRIDLSVGHIYDAAMNEKFDNPVVKHQLVKVNLPYLPISEQSYNESKAQFEACKDTIDKNPGGNIGSAFMGYNWYGGVVERYELLKENPAAVREYDVHVIRIGDTVIASNPFELYCEYGIRIKARSKATQTFLFQMCGEGSYLPTERAISGGHYSAVPMSNVIGPVGGQMLVDESVKAIDDIFK